MWDLVGMTDRPARFLSLAQVCQTMNISSSQGYSLVRNGELAAIQIGGRGIWRIEVCELEAYIQRQYAATRATAADAEAQAGVSGG